MYHDHHWESTKNQNHVETLKQKSPNWAWESDLEYIQQTMKLPKTFQISFGMHNPGVTSHVGRQVCRSKIQQISGLKIYFGKLREGKL